MTSLEPVRASVSAELGPFPDLYTAVYAILDDAKACRRLVKVYKGSHLSPDPHPQVLDFATFFAQYRRGPLGFACERVGRGEPGRRWRVEHLDDFDQAHHPRIPLRSVFTALERELRRPGESSEELLARLASRTHSLGNYRGGTSGFDDEARAIAAEHFRGTGVPSSPREVQVFCGGAKGVFLAFCAAVMCRRVFDELRHAGGVLLAPEGYYQSLRLIPAVFGGDIDLVNDLTATTVRRWLVRTAGRPNRAVYVPLVNNSTGQVLTAARARGLAVEIRAHNLLNPGNPVYVLGDDVYAGSYLSDQEAPMPIGAAPGMSYCTVSVTSPSKTFALPTSRVAFATTANPQLRAALAHYRTVFSHGRVPQANELTAAAALALTPTEWITDWNHRYRNRLTALDSELDHINRLVGFPAVTIQRPEGGWYVPLVIDRRVFPVTITSNIDAFAILLHFGDTEPDTGIGTLPGELFGHRLAHDTSSAVLRATLALPERDFRRLIRRLGAAVTTLTGPDGPRIADRALRRAREVADIDQILAYTHY